jgi:type I restriction-modification system DNA methylase subunit
MPLFQESIVKKHLSKIDESIIESAYLEYKRVYSPEKIKNIKVAKEEQYQEGFIKDVFGSVLGYSVYPEHPFNIETEKKNETNAKKADGAILKDEKVVGVIELKDNKTKNLEAVKDQAFGYKNNHKECSYVISSNFHKLRFYIDDATDYEEFDLYNLDKETFKRFFLYLRKEGLLDKNLPKLLREETKFHEEEISKKLYKDYSNFKRSFYENAVKNNPDHDKLILFKKSQKFLDRILFLLFAEDKGLVGTNSIVNIVEKWSGADDDYYRPLYEMVNTYFGHLYRGYTYQKTGEVIPQFGGELFAPDDVLEVLKIDDDVLKNDLLVLSKYDFNTDVDVNILGHIFEHSLNEVDDVEAELRGEQLDKTKSKRKKDGVFYTPKYITKYIVDNTLGKLCSEKKAELKLDQDIAIFDYQKADGKLNEKGKDLYERLNTYKSWLLTLKVCDPACGSGAFLNQALSFFIEEHKFVDDIIAELTNTPLRLFDTDLQILENNIFGVDINEESIEIAKLSLWLRTAQSGRKLSDLSNNIKCGNSLIDDPEVAGEKAFSWETEFKEVFTKGGFDVVIGNPPYVRSRDLFKEDEKNYYTKKFLTASYQLDLYKLFIEKSCNLISKSGKLSFITPSVFLNNDFDKPLRKYILDNYSLELIATSEKDVFQDASVKTVIFLVSNHKNQNQVQFFSIQKGDFHLDKVIPQQTFIDQNYLINENVNEDAVQIINKMNCFKKLGEFFEVKNGIKVRKELLFPNKQNDNFKPFVLGKNILEYKLNYDGIYIDYRPENESLYTNQAFRSKEIFEQNKLITRQILGKRLMTCFDSDNYYTDQTTYVINGVFENQSLKYLLCLVNSKLYFYYFKNTFSDNKETFPKVKRSQLLELPYNHNSIQKPLEDAANLRISLVNDLFSFKIKFLNFITSKYSIIKPTKKLQEWHTLEFSAFIKELNKILVTNKETPLPKKEEFEWMELFEENKKKVLDLKTLIDQTDKEIDRMVYELYGLTEEEIHIVENS